MKKRLTVSIDQSVIENAKRYAEVNKVSLSSIVESYFSRLLEKNRDSKVYTVLVEELSGVIGLPDDFDLKESYVHSLIEKHG